VSRWRFLTSASVVSRDRTEMSTSPGHEAAEFLSGIADQDGKRFSTPFLLLFLFLSAFLCVFLSSRWGILWSPFGLSPSFLFRYFSFTVWITFFHPWSANVLSKIMWFWPNSPLLFSPFCRRKGPKIEEQGRILEKKAGVKGEKELWFSESFLAVVSSLCVFLFFWFFVP